MLNENQSLRSIEEIFIPVIRKQKSITYKVTIGLCIVLWLLTLLSFIEGSVHKETLLITSTVISIGASLFIDFRSSRVKEYKIIGKILINQDEIVLELDNAVEKFKMEGIKNLEFNINETSKDIKGWGEGLWGINKLKDGIRNSISFKTEKDQFYFTNVLIHDSQTIEILDSFLADFKRPFLLKRSYKRIESIKDEHYKAYPRKYFN